MKRFWVAPSILSADPLNLAAELDRISAADAVHVDIMDNHFVPNLTWGLPTVEALARSQKLPLDVHLMISDQDRLAPAYAEAGSESVTVHFEACQDPVKVAREIRRLGARPAIALKPSTPVSVLDQILTEFDMVLVMTVEPGFGGQSFMPEMLAKVRQIRSRLARENLDIRLQVDGGVKADNIALAAEAGADFFVAGSAVFGSDSPGLEISRLREAARAHIH
ncbi:ribulose-phosphate 3-epimerase [Boudabousia liubingyangii]|uniref:ribulose-phosphate 3-epimerase n=1 Tax=Boudabousia liubingyangii TaxID=1921764 RepID=UPI00093EEFD2|nr:ribulose-phosphate 3-epimerase [Boudabousia liubingyangii]OKL47695.1 ribulose-phosphate 3-epimerase [Boudabousia liubingyangii]